MTPKPTLAGPSNGLHLHLPLVNVNVEHVSADHFIAGVLDHMGSLCAFGMANYDGYARSVGDAAGAWIGFGTDNRDLPVRKISDWHWEFRMMDGTAKDLLEWYISVKEKEVEVFRKMTDEQRRLRFLEYF